MKSWKATLLLGLITIIANISEASVQVVDKVVAIVNSSIVLKSDIDNLMQFMKFNFLDQTNYKFLNDIATLRSQILENLILDQIVLQIGHKRNIQISDEQINQAINNIAKQHNVNPNTIRNNLKKNGINYSTYCNQIRKELLISEIFKNEVRHRVIVLPKEVEILAKQISNQYNDNTELNLSYIFIPLSKNPTSDQITEAENQARSIIEQAHNNDDFSKLTVNYPTFQNKIKVNRTGWIRIQELPLIFIQALSTAKKDDIIGPIRLGIGFYILKINDLHRQIKNSSITEVHIRHILIKKSDTMTDNQIREKLEQIAASISSGKMFFTDAAKKFSQDPASANRGGDLGWSSIDVYDPAIRDVLTKLKRGQISVPVRSSFGWHLIEILDIISPDKMDEIRKDQAYRTLFNWKFHEETEKWLQEQRASAYVKILK